MSPTPLFDLGRVVATPRALRLLTERRVDVVQLLWRHVTGDWGQLDEHDRAANDHAVTAGLRILSSYRIGEEKFWIITEADRTATTFLLPSEY